jgi:hypothetical protein
MTKSLLLSLIIAGLLVSPAGYTRADNGPAKIGDYSLKIPKVLSRVDVAPTGTGLIINAWAGKELPNGIQPSLVVVIAENQKFDGPDSAAPALAGFLASIESERDGWTQTKIRQAQVNGLVFARSSWTGLMKSTRQPMRGIAIVAMDGRTMIQMGAQTSVDDDSGFLAMCDRAVLTLQREK